MNTKAKAKKCVRGINFTLVSVSTVCQKRGFTKFSVFLKRASSLNPGARFGYFKFFLVGGGEGSPRHQEGGGGGNFN